MSLISLNRLATSAFLAAALFTGGCAQNHHSITTTHAGPDTRNTDAKRVTLRRTSHGIVHITAGNYHDAGFGVGYAYTQDNRCLLAKRVAQVNGRLAAQLGAERLIKSEVHDLSLSALQSDHYHLGWFDKARIIANFEQGSPDVLALADGYAAGVNRFLADNDEHSPYEVRFTGAITREDVLLMWVATATVTSGEMVAGFLPHIAAPETSAATVFSPRPRAGSNAWAIGRDATRDGRSIHLYNPHFPWAGIHRTYLVHVTIPGELDVMGITLGGLPLPLAGFTRHLAWGLTLSPAARWSVAELTLGDTPLTYIVDGDEKKISTQMLSIPVRGETSPRRVPFYRADGMPIVHAPEFMLGWDARRAYAAHDANADNTRMIEQFLRLAQAENVTGMRDRLAAIQGVPWSYVVASDINGDVFFGDVSSMPGLTKEHIKRCIPPSGQQEHLAHSVVVLDGSRSECRWQQRMPAENQPQTIRSDYVANSNNNYELPNVNERLHGFSPVLGVENSPLSLRASLGLNMIIDRLSGADGLGEPGFTSELARQVFFSDRNRSAELLVGDIVAECRARPHGQFQDMPVDISGLCAVLADWDRDNTVTSRGSVVFRGLWMALSESIGTSALFETPASLDRPLSTPAGLSDDPGVRQAVRDALARIAVTLEKKAIAADMPWGEAQKVKTPRGDFAIPGGLGSEGIFDTNISTVGYNDFDAWSDALGQAYEPDTLYGACYLHVVTLRPQGPDAFGVLPFGQASDPASPWYLDQVKNWSENRWFRLPFSDTEITADPALSVLELTPR